MKLAATLARTVRHAATLAAVAIASLAGAVRPISAADSAEDARPATPRTIVDPAVSPAGGGHCSHCPPGRCQHAPRAGHGHHAGCRNGVCVPYCPVRPHQYGFYGTRWRKWPGQDVVPVSAERAVTPAVPPRSAVPGADEESMSPRAGGMPLQDAGPAMPEAPDFPAAEGGTAGPQWEPAPMPQPAPEARPAPPSEPLAAPTRGPAPAVPAAPAEPPAAPRPQVPAEPAPKTAPTPPEDENLFEVRSSPKARRKFAIQATASSGDAAAAGTDAVRPVRHLEAADAFDVPPVPFDAAAETRRVRSQR